MADFKRKTNVNSVEIVQVIKIVSVVGRGTDDDPVRKITEYYSMDGEFLARRDFTEQIDGDGE